MEVESGWEFVESDWEIWEQKALENEREL